MSKRNRFSVKLKTAEIVLAVLIFLSGISLGFSGGGFIVDANRIGFSILSTAQDKIHYVTNGVTSFFTSIRQLANLKKEYNLLAEKLKDYEYMQRSNTEIRKENERLRQQLKYATEVEYKNISAQIIGRDPDNLYSGVTINKGAKHGIKKGLPVIAIQNGNVGVVGKVITVGTYTSLIMPVYDSNCYISTRIQNTRDIGIVSGTGSYDTPLKLQYIRKRVLDSLNKGDIVVTSGENENYMKDIPIGRISKINVLDYDSSLDIEIEPIIDFLRLENVIIVDQHIPNDRNILDLHTKKKEK